MSEPNNTEYQPIAAVVNTGDFGVEIFPADALQLDVDGTAHNLEVGTEYILLDISEHEAYEQGLARFKRLEATDERPEQFGIEFPILRTMKKSIQAIRSTQEVSN